MHLPPQVIRHLIDFMHEGCEVTTLDESFEGKQVRRYIANGNTVLWTEEIA